MAMIDEIARLQRSINVGGMSFEDIMRLLRSYAKLVLLTEETVQLLKIDLRLWPQFVRLVENAERRKDPDPAQCKADRVAAWNIQMSLPKGGKESQLAEVVVLCTHDRESAEFDTFGPDAMIESIMTSICALGDGFCRGFVDFAVKP